jgi:hypothetical protein
MAETPAFDFAALQVEEAEVPKIKRGRDSQVDYNPFIKWLEDSYADRTGRAVTVPKNQLKTTIRLIRTAGQELGIGARIVTSLKGEALEKAANNKNIKVTFQGQTKKKYTKRAKDAEPTRKTMDGMDDV